MALFTSFPKLTGPHFVDIGYQHSALTFGVILVIGLLRGEVVRIASEGCLRSVGLVLRSTLPHFLRVVVVVMDVQMGFVI